MRTLLSLFVVANACDGHAIIKLKKKKKKTIVIGDAMVRENLLPAIIS